MPGQGAENRAGRGTGFQPRKDHQPQVTTLRDYWDTPTGLLPSHSAAPPRRTALPVTTPSLWEQTAMLDVPSVSSPLPLSAESSHTVSAYPPDAEAGHILDGTLVAHPGHETKHLRERLQRRGVSSLSNEELLALVFRTGQASERIVPRLSTLLASYSVQHLLHVDFGELCQQYGLGEVKAAQLQAVLEVARRLTLPSDKEKYPIRSPADAAALVRADMEFLGHEEMRVLVLNTKNQVEANLLLYQGTINSSVLRAAEIFRPAVTRNCPGIIICHNHPSGDPTPSPEDITVTEQLIQAGKLLDVDLVDHLIIGNNHRFVSLKERLRW